MGTAFLYAYALSEYLRNQGEIMQIERRKRLQNLVEVAGYWKNYPPHARAKAKAAMDPNTPISRLLYLAGEKAFLDKAAKLYKLHRRRRTRG